MAQRAVQARLEEALQMASVQPSPSSDLLFEMIRYDDLKEVLVRACHNPAARLAVSHYVDWMRDLAPRWTPEELLLEVLAVIAIAIDRPPSEEVEMT